MALTVLQPESVPANILSRRAILGALAVGPVMATPLIAAASPARSDAWHMALAKMDRADRLYTAACAAEDAASACYYAKRRPRNSRPSGITFQVGDTIETGFARATAARDAWDAEDASLQAFYRLDELSEATTLAGDEASAAMQAVFALPSPDLSALARKLELAIEEDTPDGSLGMILADIRRLASAPNRQDCLSFNSR